MARVTRPGPAGQTDSDRVQVTTAAPTDRQTDREPQIGRQMDRQTVTRIRQTDRQSRPPPGPPPPPREWALRRTPGPRPRGLGGPAQGNREYVGGGTCRYCA